MKGNPYRKPGLGELDLFVCLRCDFRGAPGEFDCQRESIGCPECKDVKALAGMGSGQLETAKGKIVHVTLWWTEYHAHRNAMARRLGIDTGAYFPKCDLRVAR